jgi:hypothetical protein
LFPHVIAFGSNGGDLFQNNARCNVHYAVRPGKYQGLLDDRINTTDSVHCIEKEPVQGEFLLLGQTPCLIFRVADIDAAMVTPAPGGRR